MTQRRLGGTNPNAPAFIPAQTQEEGSTTTHQFNPYSGPAVSPYPEPPIYASQQPQQHEAPQQQPVLPVFVPHPPPHRVVFQYNDDGVWGDIWSLCRFLQVSNRRSFKDWKRQHPDTMVPINIGGVSRDKRYALFAAGCLALRSGVPVYDVLTKGEGTVRFHVWECDLPILYNFAKRVGMNQRNDAPKEPEVHMRCTCEGDVWFISGPNALEQINGVHRCNRRYGCPNWTCDITYAYGGQERIGLRNTKKAKEEQQGRFCVYQQQQAPTPALSVESTSLTSSFAPSILRENFSITSDDEEEEKKEDTKNENAAAGPVPVGEL